MDVYGFDDVSEKPLLKFQLWSCEITSQLCGQLMIPKRHEPVGCTITSVHYYSVVLLEPKN